MSAKFLGWTLGVALGLVVLAYAVLFWVCYVAEARLEGQLAEAGLTAKVHLRKVGWPHSQASVAITRPFALTLDPIDIDLQWEPGKPLTFCLKGQQLATQETQWSGASAGDAHLQLCGQYFQGQSTLTEFEGRIALGRPLQAQLSVPRQKPDSKQWRIEATVAAQDIPLRDWMDTSHSDRLRLTKPLELTALLEDPLGSLPRADLSAPSLTLQYSGKAPQGAARELSALLEKPSAKLAWMGGRLALREASTRAKLRSGPSHAQLRARVNGRRFEVDAFGSLSADQRFLQSWSVPDIETWQGEFKITAQGDVAPWRTQAQLSLTQTQLRVFGLDISGLALSTRLACAQTSDCRLGPGEHRLRVSRLGKDLAFERMHLELSSLSQQPDSFEGALAADWNGSELRSRKLHFEQGTIPKLHARVDWQKVPLGPLLKLAASDRLSGQGTLQGYFEIQAHFGEKWVLSPSTLESTGPGWVRYLDPTTASVPKTIDTLGGFTDLLALGQQALVFKALDNFHYSLLRVELERPSDKSMKVQVALRGNNPELARGQPFEINVPIEGDIEGLLMESVYRTLAGSNESRDYISRIRKLRKK